MNNLWFSFLAAYSPIVFLTQVILIRCRERCSTLYSQSNTCEIWHRYSIASLIWYDSLSPPFLVNIFLTPFQLCEALKRETQAGPKDVNILNWLSRTALELIGQGGLGHSFDPLIEDKQNHFGDALKALVSVRAILSSPHISLNLMFVDSSPKPRIRVSPPRWPIPPPSRQTWFTFRPSSTCGIGTASQCTGATPDYRHHGPWMSADILWEESGTGSRWHCGDAPDCRGQGYHEYSK